ncbi:zinc finger protein 184-like [Onthophagus taurus]|uniref:zinc finger protein 184-like n=1 Tax=Onthophagus taurus TaxID=166361 RepID=UPI000C2061B5|nr:oocyte zinc finger protein XlCOF26-like [Onthophagus taurus]
MGRSDLKTNLSDFTSTETETSSDESISNNKEKKFKCTHAGCLAAFSKNRKLINHIRLHTGERPFQCSNCTKAYTNSSHLRRHQKIKHENGTERLTCPFDDCNREIANKWGLKKHIQRCHDPKRVYPFNCKQCSQGFLRKRHLQQHSYVHTGELPFKCDQCDKGFVTVRDCNRHKRVHLNTYTCECGDVLDKWSLFLEHRRECQRKRLNCSICNKNFASKHNLKQHQETHKSPDEKDVFLCPHKNCERVYLYKKNLDFHIKRFHEKVDVPKIPCHYEGCNKMLSKMQNYKIHIEKCHLNTKSADKKPRKTRKDKGSFKKSIRSKLTGLITLNNEISTNTNTEIE